MNPHSTNTMGIFLSDNMENNPKHKPCHSTLTYLLDIILTQEGEMADEALWHAINAQQGQLAKYCQHNG